MSIYNIHKAPVRWIRSFFFLVTLVMCALTICSITCFASSVVFTQNIYHQHTGDSNGGGCYSQLRSGTTTTEVPCGGSMVYFPAQDESKCSRCAASYHGDQSHRGCWHSDTITTSYSYYDLGCNMDSSTIVGTFAVEKSTEEWTKSLQLIASYQMSDGVNDLANPFIWDNGEATEQNSYTVTKNGDYSLRLNLGPDMATGEAVVSVKNIDVTAPVADFYKMEPEEEWTKEGVWVTLGEVKDLQPDGSEGSGLHESPYSFDGGETWTDERKGFYAENGTYTVLVRDKLENVSSYEVTIKNVDKNGPTIERVDYDDSANLRTTTITVAASDLQPDGSAGSGLHENPYSFDGGETWNKEPEWMVDRNGTITIAVRDKLENVVFQEIVITNIDNFAPVITYEMVHPFWTNRDVNLYLSAQDINGDGSEGIGLADKWYSLDGGQTWTDEAFQVYEENQEVTVLARDKHDNQSSVHISIRQIDKDLPWVSIKMEILGEGEDKKVRLTAFGGDDYSGLHEEGYSWDKGRSYGKNQTMIVTENGLYQATVRDKAGNWNYEQIEVDVFEVQKKEEPMIKEKTKRVEKPKEPVKKIEEKEEQEPEPIVVKQEKRIDAPKEKVVQEIEKDAWDWKDTLALVCGILLGIMLLVLLLLLWLRTIAVYVEDEQGNMRYRGRQWIHHKEERYEVHFSDSFLEQCVTTHFNLRPSHIFVGLHKDESICCLFPEELCITLRVERNMDFSLV